MCWRDGGDEIKEGGGASKYFAEVGREAGGRDSGRVRQEGGVGWEQDEGGAAKHTPTQSGERVGGRVRWRARREARMGGGEVRTKAGSRWKDS